MTAAAQPPAESQPEPRSPRLNEQAKALLGVLAAPPVTIPRAYLGLMGDLSGAYMLNQVVYWSDRGGSEDGTFYKSVKEWEAETLLAKHTINKWLGDFERRGWLISMGLKKVKGAPTRHWAFNSELFLDDLMSFLKDPEPSPSPFGRNQQKDPEPSPFGRNRQIPESPKASNGKAESGETYTIEYNNRLLQQTITEGGGSLLRAQSPAAAPAPRAPQPLPPLRSLSLSQSLKEQRQKPGLRTPQQSRSI